MLTCINRLAWEILCRMLLTKFLDKESGLLRSQITFELSEILDELKMLVFSGDDSRDFIFVTSFLLRLGFRLLFSVELEPLLILAALALTFKCIISNLFSWVNKD